MNEDVGMIKRIVITLSVIVSFFVVVFLITIKLICSDISPAAKQKYAVAMMDNGELCFPANLFLSKEEAQQLANDSVMSVKNGAKGGYRGLDGIEMRFISGHTFLGKLLIVHDPSRVKLSSIYPWKPLGLQLHEFAKKDDALGVINSGMYVQTKNLGGRAKGVVVCNGEIQMNEEDYHPYQLIALDRKNRLHVIDLSKKSTTEVEKIIKEKDIRDAVVFPDQFSDGSDWLVRLLNHDEERKVNPRRCCINPRTVIGQRADGAILFLVVDGRGAGAHLGATAADLVRVMKENGAVVAANLDGGSSTSMYLKDKYEMTSPSFHYAKSSWNFPTAFIIEKR